MPKVELTMNQWGLVLRAVRYTHAVGGWKNEDKNTLFVIEDRIIDMAFQLAKEREDELTAKKSPEESTWEYIAEKHAMDTGLKK